MLSLVSKVAGAFQQIGKLANSVMGWFKQNRRDELVKAEDDRDELVEERERVQGADRARRDVGDDSLRSDDGYRRD